MAVMTLSARLVAGLACPDDRAKWTVRDAQCRGLMLELRRSGGSTWYLRYTSARGQARQLRLGPADILSLAQARARAREILAQVALGGDPADARRLQRNTMTLQAFVSMRYLPYVQTYKRSWQTDVSLLGNHVLPIWGTLFLDEIDRDQVLALLQRRKATGAADSSINRLLLLVRYLFNLALKWETPGVTRNPTQDVPLFRLNNQRDRYLTHDEAQRLAQALKRSRTALPSIVPMLLLTGARKREVLDARWEDMDLHRRLWRIPISKSGKARFVPLSDAVIGLLSSLPRESEDEWVFPNPKTGLPYVSVHDSWDRVRRQAGMPELRMHDLRHSFASFLVNAGRSLYEVQNILGHAQIATTQRYSHLSQETLLQATNVVGGGVSTAFTLPSVR